MAENQEFKFEWEECGKKIVAWWEDLTSQGESGKKADSGGRAELRRCRSVLEVQLCPAFHRLHNRLPGWPPGQQDRLAVIAGVLAHVKARPARDEGQRTPSLGRLMALPKKPGGPQRVSGLRFRRLIQVPDRVELYPRLVRVLAQLDHTADVWSLARDIYFWGPNVQQAWAYDYYALAPDSSDTKAA